jgi:hypothetical protein
MEKGETTSSRDPDCIARTTATDWRRGRRASGVFGFTDWCWSSADARNKRNWTTLDRKSCGHRASNEQMRYRLHYDDQARQIGKQADEPLAFLDLTGMF